MVLGSWSLGRKTLVYWEMFDRVRGILCEIFEREID